MLDGGTWLRAGSSVHSPAFVVGDDAPRTAERAATCERYAIEVAMRRV
jgi:hypothetical protein